MKMQATATIAAKGVFKKVLTPFGKVSIISGLGGNISLQNKTNNLAQALITIWVTPEPTEPWTFETYDQMTSKYPLGNILFREILKSSQVETVSQIIDTDLVSDLSDRGYISLLIDGGEPINGGQVIVNCDLDLRPSPRLEALDWEFCYGQEWGCQLHSLKTTDKDAFINVHKIEKPTTLLQLVGNVSAGPFTGQPYANPPSGQWAAFFGYYVWRGCSLPSGSQGPNDYKIPNEAIKLTEITLKSSGRQAQQQPISLPVTIQLNPGDAIVSLAKFIADDGGATIESQISALIQ